LSVLPRGPTDSDPTADILNKASVQQKPRLSPRVVIDRPRHGRLQAHSLMPREYGVELSGVWIEPSHNGKRTAPELKSSLMIFSCQPAPNARQPGLSFARHASRAVIVAQLNEPGG